MPYSQALDPRVKSTFLYTDASMYLPRNLRTPFTHSLVANSTPSSTKILPNEGSFYLTIMSTPDPEKVSLQDHQMQNTYKPTKASMPNATWSRLRRFAVVGLFVLILTLSYRGYCVIKTKSNTGPGNLGISSTDQQNTSMNPVTQNPTGSDLVPLEAHIMSKCPDARDCLRDMIVPAMERISDKVDFRLSFIGTYVTPPSRKMSRNPLVSFSKFLIRVE